MFLTASAVLLKFTVLCIGIFVGILSETRYFLQAFYRYFRENSYSVIFLRPWWQPCIWTHYSVEPTFLMTVESPNLSYCPAYFRNTIWYCFLTGVKAIFHPYPELFLWSTSRKTSLCHLKNVIPPQCLVLLGNIKLGANMNSLLTACCLSNWYLGGLTFWRTIPLCAIWSLFQGYLKSRSLGRIIPGKNLKRLACLS